MKKKIVIILTLVVILLPGIAGAVEFNNPAGNFLIDLTRPGINQTNTFAGLLTYLIRLVLTIVGLVAIVFIMLGGFQYITARGDEEKASAGKKTLTNAIIGLVIVILSYMIVAVIMNALQGRA
jgi:hypothetical protein